VSRFLCHHTAAAVGDNNREVAVALAGNGQLQYIPQNSHRSSPSLPLSASPVCVRACVCACV